ncbi:hypothetical protein HPB50_010245 [Hyalomma asiaticum]|uniref:Uncharacterized protein n=1 Tax=Hyalomma asiaticum TaxID=266040 RepID=A0ACB7SD24_HYAAI|nr:hypothetical protein HPB50_010245 [Hyalomma asiaticum]
MVETLNSGLPAGKGPYSVKQVRQKLENLNRQYSLFPEPHIWRSQRRASATAHLHLGVSSSSPSPEDDQLVKASNAISE